MEVTKNQVSVKVGADYIIGPGGLKGQKLSRPLESPDFDWSTVQGMSIMAKSLEQERRFSEALERYMNCLDKDPNYIPALVGASGLMYRHTEYGKAMELVKRALSIDTYHPAANFLYGALNHRAVITAPQGDAVRLHLIFTSLPGMLLKICNQEIKCPKQIKRP